jgi:phage-related protein
MMVATPAAVKPSCEINGMSALTMALGGIDRLWTLAQCGTKAHNAVPMVGFGGAKVLEVVINDDGDTYRAVYTVKFQHAVYVLHAFQKKSKRGSETPKPELALIHSRLKTAQKHHDQTYRTIKEESKNEKGA